MTSESEFNRQWALSLAHDQEAARWREKAKAWNPPPPAVFLSFSAHDVEAVHRLGDVLAARSIPCFKFTTDMMLGDEIVARVTQDIKASTHLVLFLTAESLRSHWLAFELGLAEAAGLKVLSLVTPEGLALPDIFRRYVHTSRLEELLEHFDKPMFEDAALESFATEVLGMDRATRAQHLAAEPPPGAAAAWERPAVASAYPHERVNRSRILIEAMDPHPVLRVTEWQPGAERPQWDCRLSFVEELKGLVVKGVQTPLRPDLGIGLRYERGSIADRGWHTNARFWRHTVDRLRAELSPR